MKRGCWIFIVGLLVLLVCLVAGVLGFLLIPTAASMPQVFIHSPLNGERVVVGQDTFIHASARGEQKIKRIELWVNGALQDAQTSNVPGGVSPFPIVVHWRPPVSGTHNIVVRAFNSQNTRGNAEINVQAVASGDRDNDGTPDAIDGCPDQPGISTNNGCPAPIAGDRDGDGVPDSSDKCADQPGTTLAEGCPDADGDSIADARDACPREFGSAERNGCPVPGDADGDGGVDSADDCPREPGPASTRGCPDRDGDGVRDRVDACPDHPGVAGFGGCPDRDGDGVRDAIDLCPDVPGLASNAGCPTTSAGDRDGDGVRDDTDLAPDEAGAAESGGAPPPGGGADRDSDGRPDAEEAATDPLSGFDLLLRNYLMRFVPVELQALEFQVSGDYTSVYCYASVAGRAEERIGPFAPLGARRWDIAAFLGPLNSRTFMAPAGQPLHVRVECNGIVGGIRVPPGGGIGEGGGSEAYFDLGTMARTHTITTSTIDEVTVESSGGNPGHSFRVKYRVCSPGCGLAVLPAPMITLVHGGGQHRLVWVWSGHAYDINGFKLYMNGSYMFSVDAHSTSYLFRDVPPCGRRFDIQLSAYRGNPHRPDSESPLSNVATWHGGLCPRTATVSFERLITRSFWPQFFRKPTYGSFCVGDECRAFESEMGVMSNATQWISDLLPRNTFTTDLEPDDSLYLAMTIRDRDPGRDDTLFDQILVLPPAEIVTREIRTISYENMIVIQLSVRDR